MAADLYESAAVEGKRLGRSTRQQLGYWARVGREVTSHQSADLRRIEALLADAGPIPAEIDARVQEDAEPTDAEPTDAAPGITTVSLNSENQLVETAPDGTTRIVR